MPWWGLMLWGLGGVVVLEMLDWTPAIKRTKGWPWNDPDEPGFAPFLFTVLVRLAAGAFVTAGLAVGGQVSSILPAIGVGVAAPVILEKLGRTAESLAGASTSGAGER